jgi:hypothetical protein
MHSAIRTAAAIVAVLALTSMVLHRFARGGWRIAAVPVAVAMLVGGASVAPSFADAPAGYAISGTVSLGYQSTAAAAPAAGVVVSYQIHTLSGWSSALGTVPTDSTGAYQIPALADGTYLIHFHYTGSGDYQDLYYSRSAFISGAQLVTVQSVPVQLANVGLPEPQSFGGTVSLAPSGATAGSGAVTLTATYDDADQSKTLPAGTTTTDASGHYEFTNLPESGHYEVSAVYNGPPTYFAISNKPVVSALGAPIRDVNLVLTRSFSLTGHIDLGTAGHSAGDGEIQVQVVNSSTGQVVDSVNTQANGNFAAVGLAPGTYLVNLHYTGTGDYPDLTVSSDGSCAGSCTFTITNSDATLSAVMPMGNGISGVITGTDGRTLSGLTVDATRVDPTTRSPLDYFSTATGADGSYAFRDLPNGSYELNFVDNSGNYLDQTYNNQPLYNDPSEPDLVALAPGTYFAHLDPVLQQLGIIAGTIQVVGGYAPANINGLVEVELETFNATSQEYEISPNEGPVTATFLADGSITYVVPALVPGNYKLRFVSNADGRSGAEVSPVITVVAGHAASYNAIIQTAIVPPPAFGAIDTAVVSPGQLTMTGWALAPGWGDAVFMLVQVDGVFQSGSVLADGYKAGLSAAFPGETDQHGFTVTLNSLPPGTHTVCVEPDYQWSYPGTPMCRTLTVLAGSPIGVIDSATAGPGTITVQGWAFDPDTTNAVSVNVTLDGVPAGTVVANGVKAGLGTAFPAYGDDHGYTVNLTGVTGGSHTVCIVGVNVSSGSNGAPWCRPVSIPTGPPIGVIDSATVSAGASTISGWMLDPDAVGPVSVGVTIDGAVGGTVVADGAKSGLGVAFPGYGDNHGYSVSLTGLSGGNHTVCVSGVNVGSGSNGVPICKTVLVPTGSPYGVIDHTAVTAGTVAVDGWMIDPDTASAITVNATLDGHAASSATAGGVKLGLGAAFPGYGDNHDYTVLLSGLSAGSHTLCVYGVNVGPGSSGTPICRSIVVASGPPFGVIDTLTVSAGLITATGWMLDPDTASAIQVNVKIDGTAVGQVPASGVKAGLDAAFPGYGDDHDYSFTTPGVALPGMHQVCVQGVNVGGGVNGAWLCQTIAVTATS